MINFNLKNLDNSDIKYKVSKFPDGQQTIDLTEWRDLLNPIRGGVKISSRLNSFRDLELIICAVQAVRNINPTKNISLYVPYFLGARSDRKFKEGGVNYLKQVICPIINSLNLISVEVLDPHSDVLEACLNNFKKKDNHELVKFALERIDNKNGAQDRICLVSPDAGSYKKIYIIAEKYQINNVVVANKVRDIKTGNILKTEVPELDLIPGDNQFVIIDDICDGGRTFIELAKAIGTEKPLAKIHLVVTHGIFSAGLKPLNQYFDGIYTTNSVADKFDPDFISKNNEEIYNFLQFEVI